MAGKNMKSASWLVEYQDEKHTLKGFGAEGSTMFGLKSASFRCVEQDGRAAGGGHGVGNIPAAQVREPAPHSVPSVLERIAARCRRSRLSV